MAREEYAVRGEEMTLTPSEIYILQVCGIFWIVLFLATSGFLVASFMLFSQAILEGKPNLRPRAFACLAVGIVFLILLMVVPSAGTAREMFEARHAQQQESTP